MQRIVAGITTLEGHLETIRQKPEVYQQLSCPHFGIKQLRQQGYYYRKADRRARRPPLDPVPICRYRCARCQRAFSRLAECIAPQRSYRWPVQQQSLSSRVGATPARCGDEGQLAARSIGRWWRWLRDRGSFFAFSSTGTFSRIGSSQ